MLGFELEKSLFNQGYKFIGSLDEAGRGPLAGPVIAACVVFSQDFKISGRLAEINDSKKLSAKVRQELYELINQGFLEVGVGSCDHKTIDKINILQATFLAMKKALGALKRKPDYLLIDGGQKIPNCSVGQRPVIKGDERIFTIAAASIIAKVTRDKIMEEMHLKFPQYGFNLHKGYGTKLHFERLHQYGPCEIHRLSFNRVKG